MKMKKLETNMKNKKNFTTEYPTSHRQHCIGAGSGLYDHWCYAFEVDT